MRGRGILGRRLVSSDLTRLPASTLREKIARKEVSPVELMKAVLARAETLQPILNCFITLIPERAMAPRLLD